MEKVVKFGPGNCLVGIITSAASEHPSKPAVVFINAGLVHRVGPYRLYTDLARELARVGFSSLRFDLSGIGDSAQRRDSVSYEQRSIDEIRTAMDFMEQTQGAQGVVLVGLCSGADNAHRIALADHRLKGAVLIDAWGYKTPGFYLHRFQHYARRMQSLKKWRDLIERHLSRIRHKHSAEEVMDLQGPGDREFLPKEQMERDIHTFVDRGMRLFYIYTGGLGTYYNHEGQFWSMFKSLNRDGPVKSLFFGDADHTFTLLRDRKQLLERVSGWMEATFA